MRFAASAFGLVLAGGAGAQNLSPDELSFLPRVIDRLELNLDDGRIGFETAFLIRSGDDPYVVDLVILSDRRAGPVDLLASMPGIVWDGPAFGQAPGLSATSPNSERLQSLVLTSGNMGNGRTHWEQTLTIAFRGDAFILAGYTYAARDRLNTAWSRCDVNLLTGAWDTASGLGAVDGLDEAFSGRDGADVRPVTDWTVTYGQLDQPTVCDAVFTRMSELSDMDIPR